MKKGLHGVLGKQGWGGSVWERKVTEAHDRKQAAETIQPFQGKVTVTRGRDSMVYCGGKSTEPPPCSCQCGGTGRGCSRRLDETKGRGLIWEQHDPPRPGRREFCMNRGRNLISHRGQGGGGGSGA